MINCKLTDHYRIRINDSITEIVQYILIINAQKIRFFWTFLSLFQKFLDRHELIRLRVDVLWNRVINDINMVWNARKYVL